MYKQKERMEWRMDGDDPMIRIERNGNEGRMHIHASSECRGEIRQPFKPSSFPSPLANIEPFASLFNSISVECDQNGEQQGRSATREGCAAGPR